MSFEGAHTPSEPASSKDRLVTRLKIDEEQLRDLAVPSDEWIAIRLGESIEPMVSKLQSHGFDQAPVVDQAGNAVGLVWTADLLDLLERKESILSDGQEAIRASRWEVGEPLDILLEKLAAHRAALIAKPEAPAFGMLSISDLSWPAFRSIFYPPFCSLEHHLAMWIADSFDDSWEWIKTIHKDQQPAIVGHWEIARKKGVETSATVGASFAQLLHVVTTNKDLRTRLAENLTVSKGQLDRLKDWRNRIAHPTRPLVTSLKEVHDLRESALLIESLEEQVSLLAREARASKRKSRGPRGN